MGALREDLILGFKVLTEGQGKLTEMQRDIAKLLQESTEAQKKTSAAAEGVVSSLQSTQQGLVQLGATLVSALGLVKGFEVGMSALHQVLDSGSHYERAREGFTALLGSIGAAEGRIASLERISNTADFSLPSLEDASQQLELFGLSTDRLLPGIARAADAMGKSVGEAVNALSLATLGQTRGLKRYAIDIDAVMRETGVKIEEGGKLTVAQSRKVVEQIVLDWKTRLADTPQTVEDQLTHIGSAFEILKRRIFSAGLGAAIGEELGKGLAILTAPETIHKVEEFGRQVGIAARKTFDFGESVLKLGAAHPGWIAFLATSTTLAIFSGAIITAASAMKNLALWTGAFEILTNPLYAGIVIVTGAVAGLAVALHHQGDEAARAADKLKESSAPGFEHAGLVFDWTSGTWGKPQAGPPAARRTVDGLPLYEAPSDIVVTATRLPPRLHPDDGGAGAGKLSDAEKRWRLGAFGPGGALSQGWKDYLAREASALNAASETSVNDLFAHYRAAVDQRARAPLKAEIQIAGLAREAPPALVPASRPLPFLPLREAPPALRPVVTGAPSFRASLPSWAEAGLKEQEDFASKLMALGVTVDDAHIRGLALRNEHDKSYMDDLIALTNDLAGGSLDIEKRMTADRQAERTLDMEAHQAALDAKVAAEERTAIIITGLHKQANASAVVFIRAASMATQREITNLLLHHKTSKAVEVAIVKAAARETLAVFLDEKAEEAQVKAIHAAKDAVASLLKGNIAAAAGQAALALAWTGLSGVESGAAGAIRSSDQRSQQRTDQIIAGGGYYEKGSSSYIGPEGPRGGTSDTGTSPAGSRGLTFSAPAVPQTFNINMSYQVVGGLQFFGREGPAEFVQAMREPLQAMIDNKQLVFSR